MNKKLQYGIVTAILLSSFLVSFSIRMQPTQYGWELDEFDPYYNYKATQFMVDNGYEEYTEWTDDRSWFPNGRNVSQTSQVALHFTTATLYQVFGESTDTDLYHFAILLPAVIGSLTVFVIFALGRVLVDTRVGVLCAVFFAMSIPFIQRGTAGWLKSEPLGVFFGLLAVYLVISALRGVDKGKIVSALKIIGAGLFIGFGLSAWGGTVYFLIPMAIWFTLLPLTMKQKKLRHALWLLPLYTAVMVSVSMLFERSSTLVLGVAGIGIFGPMLLIAIYQVIGRIKPWKNYYKYIISIAIVIILFSSLLYLGVLSGPYGDISSLSGRYMSTLNPFSVSDDPVSASVAEHQAPTLGHVFERTVFVMLFMPIGLIAIILKKYVPKETIAFILAFGFSGIYVGFSYVRLELFLAGGMILFAAIGVVWLMDLFIKSPNKTREKNIRVAMIVGLLLVMMVPTVINWSIMVDRPAIIMKGGGTIPDYVTLDWLITLDWLKDNTPDDAVVLAWWDYGYWITVLGEKITVMDNAANNSNRIIQMASIMTDTPESAYQRLTDENIDYVVFYVIAQKIDGNYLLNYGGDISKMGWIMEIGGRDSKDYKNPGSYSFNEEFWDNTLAGRMIPFEPKVLDKFELAQAQARGIEGMQFYKKAEVTTDSFELVYLSPSFYDESGGPKYVISVYKIN